jgi:hypothetical protein
MWTTEYRTCRVPVAVLATISPVADSGPDLVSFARAGDAAATPQVTASATAEPIRVALRIASSLEAWAQSPDDKHGWEVMRSRARDGI